MKQQALYRFYNSSGDLLYVGITLDPGKRWKQHRDDKPWWHEVTQVTVETHVDRDAVMQAERAAIENEHPRYNVVFNRPRLSPEQRTWTVTAPPTRRDPVRRARLAAELDHIKDTTGYGMAAAWGHLKRGEFDEAEQRIREHYGNKVTAQDMPDMCHDHCYFQAAGGIPELGVYYPWRWHRGKAYYQCARGHQWTCGWGNDESGSAPENRGVDQRLAENRERAARGERVLAYAMLTRSRDALIALVVSCPFCGKRHSHGAPAGAHEEDPRVSHCHNGTYYLQVGEVFA